MSGPSDELLTRIQALRDEESRLEAEARGIDEAASGLRDIDLTLSLASVKLSLCCALLGSPTAMDEVRERALTALRLVDGLLAENVSEDQKGVVPGHPLYARFRETLQEFLLAGGGGLLESRQADARARRIVSRAIVDAVRKFSGIDDRYLPLDLAEKPPVVQRLLRMFFPEMVREHPAPPPYGIEEGEEQTYSSAHMKLPLSQAVFYMENDLIPGLEEKLRQDPGSAPLQEEIAAAREQLEYYRKLRFFPRSTPVLLEKGFYTEGMTSYSADGEMLVPIPQRVQLGSGTNLDRLMELVRMDVVRRIAGRGVSRQVDAQYRHLKSLASGTRGSSRTPSMKLDAAWGYRVLRQEYPVLARLSDKQKFIGLVDSIRTGKGRAEGRVEALLDADQRTERPGQAPRELPSG